jgi:hypothetical protein
MTEDFEWNALFLDKDGSARFLMIETQDGFCVYEVKGYVARSKTGVLQHS